MSTPQASGPLLCAACGAAVTPEASSCWLCGKDLRAGATGGTGILPVAGEALARRQCHPAVAAGAPATRQAHPAASPFFPGVAPAEHRAIYQFGIASMLLFTTLCAVVLGAFSVAPGLGIALAILATPALIRTGIVARRRRAGGQPMSVAGKVGAFSGALALVAIIVVVVSAAFVATCFPLGLVAFNSRSEGLFPFAWVIGFLVALLVLYVLLRLFRRLWPR